MRESTADWAKGRWFAILHQFGIDGAYLTGKHTGCPICGDGKDRFRFDDKEGRGTFYCSVCGAGDGFDLLMKYNGWDFQTTAQAIDRMRGQDIPKKEVFKEPVNFQKRRETLNRVWQDAKAPEVLEQYFVRERGFPVWLLDRLSPDVRGHPSLELWADGERLGSYPAVLCLIRDLVGNPLSIHRTYLVGSGSGREKKIMPPMASITGGACRVVTKGEVSSLVVGEGIETTIAGWMFLNYHVQLPYESGAWAGISANGLREIQLPETLQTLWVCMDKDHSFTGQAATYELARRVKATGRTVRILEPDRMGTDIDDIESEAEISII